MHFQLSVVVLQPPPHPLDQTGTAQSMSGPEWPVPSVPPPDCLHVSEPPVETMVQALTKLGHTD